MFNSLSTIVAVILAIEIKHLLGISRTSIVRLAFLLAMALKAYSLDNFLVTDTLFSFIVFHLFVAVIRRFDFAVTQIVLT